MCVAHRDAERRVMPHSLPKFHASVSKANKVGSLFFIQIFGFLWQVPPAGWSRNCRIKPKTALRDGQTFSSWLFSSTNVQHNTGLPLTAALLCMDSFLGMKCQWQVTEPICAYKSIVSFSQRWGLELILDIIIITNIIELLICKPLSQNDQLIPSRIEIFKYCTCRRTQCSTTGFYINLFG